MRLAVARFALAILLYSGLLFAADDLGPATITLACGTLGDSCPDAQKAVADLVDQRLKLQVTGKEVSSGYLSGFDLKVSPVPAADSAGFQLTSELKPWAPHACSLNGHFWNAEKTEVDKNSREQSCGDFHRVECRVSTLGELRVQLIAPEPSAPESREKSWVDGAFLEALSCHRSRVLAQIRANGQLKLDPASSCRGAVVDYQARLVGHRAAAAKVPKDSNQPCPQDISPRLEQAVCYARAELQALQSVFAQIAACEIFRLADESHARVLAEFRTPSAIEGQWQTIAKDCKKSANTCEGWNACYRSKIQDTMQKRFLERYPREGECAR